MPKKMGDRPGRPGGGPFHPGLPARASSCDGDAFILSTDKLLRILNFIREKGPHIERVGVYGDARSVLHKSHEELVALRKAGLGILYHGVESGDRRGSAAHSERRGRRHATGGGPKTEGRRASTYSAIILLGAGGVKRSEEHAHATARWLTRADPDYVGAIDAHRGARLAHLRRTATWRI